MKRLILLLSIITLFCQSIAAQTGGVNFQGVARNSTGAVLANQKINLKFSILKTTETGTVEYTETKEATTNAQGIFAVVVGEVNSTSFSAIDWKVTPKFLKVEMDPAGGTSFVAMGTTRLQNVPYAFYSNGVNANNIDGVVPVTKGGTGASDVAAARANLGLTIGTNVQAPLTAGTDYLTPSGNAATASKLVAAKKINGVDFDGSTDITFAVDANTLSGTVSITKGGTGATTAAAARTNLGLTIGTNVQAPLTAGTDYLTPTGSAAGLTNFPTLNQNTTGNAATANIAGNITATSNSSLTALPNLSSVGTLTSGTISLTTDIKTSGKIVVGTFSETSSSAILEANSTTKGFLPPRMTFAQKNAITNPAQGLIVYCTDCNAYGEVLVFNGNAWTNISGGAVPGVLIGVNTGTITSVTTTAAVITGNSINNNNSIVLAQGICWSTTSGGENINGNHTVDIATNGQFSSTLTGLTAGVTYYVKAYATNSTGTSYGNEISFVCNTSNSVIPVTNITYSSAQSGGIISISPSSSVTEKGIVWGLSTGPTISSNIGRTSNGIGAGTFTATITGLNFATTYYVRSYYNTIAGTNYGTEEVFTTNGYPIGTLFGGGKIAYVLKSDDPGYVEGEFHGFIMSIEDIKPSVGDYPPYWAPLGVISNLVTAMGFGTGLSNTKALAQKMLSSSSNELYINNTASVLTRNYRGGGFTDWYLPSYTELVQIISNFTALYILNSQRPYWTSSTDPNGNGIYFDQSIQGRFNSNSGNQFPAYVRAIRSF